MNNIRSQEGHGIASHGRTKVNASSPLLLKEENEAVFKMLGRKCQTLSTAVVQIYKTEASAHSHWKKKYTGILCFVKDSAIRSYFLRAYCLMKHELIWEHELYDGMKISKARSFLLTFEGQDGHVGLNFVSEDECDAFYRAVDNTIETRNRKKLEKRNRLKSQVAPAVPVTPLPREPIQNDNVVQLRNHPKIGSVNLMPSTATSTNLLPTTASTKNFFSFSSSSSNSNKDKKRKVTKADISQPTNFMHISHVGWDANKGFDLTGSENDEVLSQFFAKAGVSETELKDRDTRAFIYDFIQSNNVLSTVKLERVEKPTKSLAPTIPTSATPMTVAKPLPPPPVPSRHQHHHTLNGGTALVGLSQRVAPPPPPPPARQPPPPIPTTIPGQTKPSAPTTRPPPLSSITMPPPPPIPIQNQNQSQSQNKNYVPPAPPAPPPPPPPAPAPTISVIPMPPPPPPPKISEPNIIPTITLSDQSKSPSSLPTVPDARNELMESIRKGVQLKKVDTSALSTGSGDSHSDLMSEIRMGIELKPTQNRELNNRNSDEFSGTDALANALRRALQERGRVMQSSDEESSSSGNDEEWDD